MTAFTLRWTATYHQIQRRLSHPTSARACIYFCIGLEKNTKPHMISKTAHSFHLGHMLPKMPLHSWLERHVTSLHGRAGGMESSRPRPRI